FIGIIAAVTGFKCFEDGKITPEHRDRIVKQTNRLRTGLAKGLYRNKDGEFMPKGSNMLEVKWDCELEYSAQSWADQCVLAHSREDQRDGIGENVYYYHTSSPKAFENSAILLGIESWWSELTKSYRNNPLNVYTPTVASQRVSQFTQVGKFF
ncbi:unnamed protein product, partial [Onchocerca flexuosa]|uniref:SCP domain-containing protein n=1 Tax=Onchocerca flexuosa TaxID=387005 RepID=A0A183HK04_9BILA